MSAIWLILKPFWKEILAVLLILGMVVGIKVHLSNDRKTEAALQASEVARKAAIAIWKAEFDRLESQLADADKAAKQAIAEKAAAEKAAAKALAKARKDWERVYGSKPENRAWADQRIPADIADRLRE